MEKINKREKVAMRARETELGEENQSEKRKKINAVEKNMKARNKMEEETIVQKKRPERKLLKKGRKNKENEKETRTEQGK